MNTIRVVIITKGPNLSWATSEDCWGFLLYCISNYVFLFCWTDLETNLTALNSPLLWTRKTSSPILANKQGQIFYLPLPADNDLLTARELELSTAKSLLSMWAIRVFATDWQKNLTDANTSTNTLGLTKSTPHASLKPISPSTWQHLVDTQHMERVNPDPQVESILARKLGHVFIASNACSFKCLTGDILLLPTDQMDTEGELINSLLLHANIIDPDLGIWDTTAVPWLRVGFVFDLAITPCRSCKVDNLIEQDFYRREVQCNIKGVRCKVSQKTSILHA